MTVKHVVVDGSNLATEGRALPSLHQLDEAVRAYLEEYKPENVTVIVDASFPNRIDRSERAAFEDALGAGELITPPAGVIGRGDAFLLQIADRIDAVVLSNDSFQEFHGQYGWLFDQGRLIGGKPVPHVGWVFMERSPVRGPQSRRSVSDAKKAAKAVHLVEGRRGREQASPPSDPPRRRRRPSAAAPAGTRRTTPKKAAAPAPQKATRGTRRPRQLRAKAAGDLVAHGRPPSTRSWRRRRRHRRPAAPRLGRARSSPTTRRCRSSSSSPPTRSARRCGARSSGSRRTGRTSSSTARGATCRSRTSPIRRHGARARS